MYKYYHIYVVWNKNNYESSFILLQRNTHSLKWQQPISPTLNSADCIYIMQVIDEMRLGKKSLTDDTNTYRSEVQHRLTIREVFSKIITKTILTQKSK